jgi:copper(I)-binding protein
VVLVFALAACAGASPAPSAGVVVTGAWVRLPAGMSANTAAYMTISAGSEADALVGASSSIASMVGIHETTTDPSGMTGMHPVARIEIPANGTVKLEPGGYHVMLEGLTQALTAGQTVSIALTFEHAGQVVVAAEVRAG